MKIRFITDGNNRLGLGHIYQSKTFANYIRERHEYAPDIIFLTKSSDEIASIIKKEGYEVKLFESDKAIFDYLAQDIPDIIIFDKLDVEPDFAKRIHECLPSRLAIYTCITDANKYADVTVIADMESDFENVCRESKGVWTLRGTKYWIMREDFYKYSWIPKESSTNIENITLIFGGADPMNYTEEVLKELVYINIPQINVIIGSAYLYENKVRKIAQNIDSYCKVNVLKNVTNVAELMHKSDLVITSPGLSMFESLKVNTPVICFYQSKLQKDIYDGFFKTLSHADVCNLVAIINKRDFIFSTDPFIKGLEIGCGIDELIKITLNKI